MLALKGLIYLLFIAFATFRYEWWRH